MFGLRLEKCPLCVWFLVVSCVCCVALSLVCPPFWDLRDRYSMTYGTGAWQRVSEPVLEAGQRLGQEIPHR